MLETIVSSIFYLYILNINLINSILNKLNIYKVDK